MYRAWVGNLDERVDEDTLRGVFEEQEIIPNSVVIKRGYAFVDCPDQASLDEAIDKLEGYNLMGSVMHVEPSVSRRRRSNRVAIRNISNNTPKDDVERLVGSFGGVQRCDLLTTSMETIVNVTYETPDQAAEAVEQLNNYDYQGAILKVDFASNGSRGNSRMGGGRPPRNAGMNNRGNGHPLRILVPADFVGAIIGRKGQTIRNITTQTRARVIVHGKDSGLLEKVISIYGQPENCTNACKEILRVMQQEAQTTNRGEITLKMLAEDRFCGRIIGKEGKVIKKIREDTDTKITVSNLQEIPSLYPDRVITIKGSIDNMCAAELAISTKLRECQQQDMQAPMGPNMMVPPNVPGLPVMSGPSIYGMRPGPYNMMQQQNPGFYPGMYSPQMPNQQPQPPPAETMHISVPNSSVGAIIGAGGSNIKQIIRDSNAFVTIEPKKDDDPNPAAERIVTIKGTPESQWRACYFVFDKLRCEGFAGNEEVRLKSAVRIPRSMVGRVIGKGGKNVRDIQRMTGAMIKLPEDQAAQGEETIVEVVGNFMATMNALARIRTLVAAGQQQVGGGMPGPNPPQRRRSQPPQGGPSPSSQ